MITALRQGALRAGRGAATVYGWGLKLYNWLRGRYDVPTPPESSQLYGLVKTYSTAGYEQHDLPPGVTLPLRDIPVNPALASEMAPGDRVQYQALVKAQAPDGQELFTGTVYIDFGGPATTEQIIELAITTASTEEKYQTQLYQGGQPVEFPSYQVQVMGVARKD